MQVNFKHFTTNGLVVIYFNKFGTSKIFCSLTSSRVNQKFFLIVMATSVHRGACKRDDVFYFFWKVLCNCWSKALWIIFSRSDPWKKAFKISIVETISCYYKPLLPPPNLSCLFQIFIHDAQQSLWPSICDHHPQCHPLQSSSMSSTHSVIHKNSLSSINKLYHYVPLGYNFKHHAIK